MKDGRFYFVYFLNKTKLYHAVISVFNPMETGCPYGHVTFNKGGVSVGTL